MKMVEQNKERRLLKPETAARIILYAYIIFYMFLMLFPIYWMFTGAFKEDIDIFNPAVIIPARITFKYFLPPYFDPIYWRWIGNSFIVSILTTIVVTLIAVPAGYALSRARGIFFSSTSKLLVFTYTFPSTFLLVGFAKLLAALGLLNSYAGLIMTYVPLNVPYVTYLVLSYMFAIPTDLDEAMLIDGYSRLDVLLKIVIPLSFPIIITGILWTFMWTWNELLYALVIVNQKELLTMPVGLNTLQGGEISPWGQVFALSFLYTIPPMLIFYALRKYYVTGLMKGAIKAA